jgi:hypothetical protein
MTHTLNTVVEELQGRPCSTDELDSLKIWARSKIHWSAYILHAIVRTKGYLMQIDSESFACPMWFGIDSDELQQGLHFASSA